MKKVSIRFYEELNEFLPAQKRKVRFTHEYYGKPSVKDLIESFNVPHTEVDLIIVNGASVDFNYLVKDSDDISIYPEFESLDITKLQRLRSKPLRKPKFVLDVHLGTLSKYMRMLGFDTRYKNNFSDNEIIKMSLNEKRTIVTRDLGILKHKKVIRGYYVRNTNPKKQIAEIINRFDLKKEIKEFTRCLDCNLLLKKVDKKKIIDQLPPKVKILYSEYFICMKCDKIYWKGSHFQNMKLLVDEIIEN
ncbi:MAG: Mut7-C ubiquitin/RNAse domain-containing protein [Ignavibacteriales bacterium]|nr:Mut7-C ubiquitin/RNAse domain-containing protein [Ignavibacteriales bacterium]